MAAQREELPSKNQCSVGWGGGQVIKELLVKQEDQRSEFGSPESLQMSVSVCVWQPPCKSSLRNQMTGQPQSKLGSETGLIDEL